MIPRRAAGLLALLALSGCALFGGPAPGLRIAVFSSDATPRIGSLLAARDELKVVEAPLLLKGILLEDGNDRFVVAALDWCTIGTYEYSLFREEFAKAAETTPDRVTVHCVHTHSAPSRRDRNRDFVRDVANRAASAVRTARAALRPFTHVGYGKAEVAEFASNRRVLDPYGKIRVRWSRTEDEYLIRAPVGTIDPWLRTISFMNGDTPIARMHYYASHPQSYYGDGRCHPDVPGWARSRLEEDEAIPHLYFTGCAGDVTAGKFNPGTPEARSGLIDRLTTAMRSSIRQTDTRSVTSLDWRTTPVRFARHPEASPGELPPIDLILLRLGPVDIVHLPGEPFVAFQLYAQAVGGDRFVAVAGYGDGGPGYICTDQAYAEGGYEPQPRASRVGPPSERILKAGIDRLLK